MKAVFLLPSLLFFLLSCSNNSDTTNEVNPDDVLLKKVVETIDGTTTTENFIYDEKKLLRIEKSNGYQKVFTYQGNLITEVLWTFQGGLQREKFFYNDQKQLIRKKTDRYFYDSNTKYTIEYTHNSDGSISYTKIQPGAIGVPMAGTINSAERIETDISETYYSYGFGNHGVLLCSGGTFSVGNKYHYDDKYNPYRNIVGFKELFFAGITDFYGSLQNNLRFKSGYLVSAIYDYPDLTCGGSSNPDSPGNNPYTTYTYNSLGFPDTSFCDDPNSGTNTNYHDISKVYFYN